jgi:hypothetical protein
MSIFSTIDKDLHTFGAWAERELRKLETEAPKLERIADAILKYCGPALQAVVTAEAGAPAGAVIGAVVADAQTSLLAANGLLTDIGPTPTIGNVIGAVSDNLSGLLSAAQVKDPKSIKIVENVVHDLSTLSTAVSAATSAAGVTPGV